MALTDLGRSPAVTMVAATVCPPLTTHLAGARFHRQTRLSVPTTSAAHGRLSPAVVAPALPAGKAPARFPGNPPSAAPSTNCPGPVPSKSTNTGQNHWLDQACRPRQPRRPPRLKLPNDPRQKPAPAVAATPRKRGRPSRGEIRPPTPPKRLELQPGRTLADNLGRLARPLRRGLQAQQPKGIRKVGSVTNPSGTPWTATSRSADF